MTENEFWEFIESVWLDSPKLFELRKNALESNNEELLEQLSIDIEDKLLKNYRKRLNEFDKVKLTNFIQTLEEKLFIIDRQEIHEYTDGSDDGFLYCRFFIVGMGEAYYNLINNNPSKATMDLEAESFGFSSYDVYEEKFGEEFERNSIHCIESCSNSEGWNF